MRIRTNRHFRLKRWVYVVTPDDDELYFRETVEQVAQKLEGVSDLFADRPICLLIAAPDGDGLREARMQADTVQDALVAHGIDASRILIQEGSRPWPDTPLTPSVQILFSGDDDDWWRDYQKAAANGVPHSRPANHQRSIRI